MNKNHLGLLSILLSIMFFAGSQVLAYDAYGNNIEQPEVKPIYKYKYNNIPLKQPALTQNMKPAVEKYKQGNFVGAMLDLRELTEKEPDNTYAKYYLALCYTQLGYRSEAQDLYQQIANSNDNFSLSYYSRKAAECLDNPDGEICLPPKKVKPPEEKVETQETTTPVAEEEVDDITKFIRSGKKIHPAAMDKITNERMERKIQADMYSRQQSQEENNNMPKKVDTSKKSDASTPTNEEIIAALDTLSKIGLNPLTQLNSFSPINTPIAAISQFGFNDSYNPMILNAVLSNGSMDNAKMLMYAQIAQQQNNILNYGI